MALSAAILAAINIHTLNRKIDLTMQEKYRKYMTWWFDEYCAGSEVDHYVEIFPELDSRLCKFGVGIYQWNMGGAGFPHDRFCYSIILVEVTPDNRIASVTSRWDSYETNPGHFLSSEALRRTIGDGNFSKLLRSI
jgi:hypothetical protein